MRYDEFWLTYLRAHSRRSTRAVHYAGTSLAAACLLGGIPFGWPSLIAAPLVGYGAAWTAHYALEGNRPQTFGHPFWSLFSDVRMLLLACSGRLPRHLRDAAVAG